MKRIQTKQESFRRVRAMEQRFYRGKLYDCNVWAAVIPHGRRVKITDRMEVPREFCEIIDAGDGRCVLTVEEARAVFEWLKRALP